MRFPAGLIIAIGASGLLHADDLTLADDARLTGQIRSISPTGVVELSSILSPEPVLLKSGAVRKVVFNPPGQIGVAPAALVELANGDFLPATVEGLDDRNLNVLTADAGRLSIPRAALKSMQLGVRKRKVIYSGPRSQDEWSRNDDGSLGWMFTKGGLTASAPAFSSKAFETPLRFILKFTLKWQANPSYQIYFADPLTPKAEAVDRYSLQFNGAGLEIRRESAKGRPPRSVILLPRTPDQFPSNQLEVEIRVDRKTSRLNLFLNGEHEADGVDPVADPPAGSGVSFANSSPAGVTQEIRGIELSEFDNARVRHRSEDRGDLQTDSLISRDEDRWSGRLLRIQPGPDGPVFSFKSDFQEEPLELLEGDVSTIFFASADKPAVPDEAHPFALRLRGEGFLRVTSCTFAGDHFIATHPLLGELKINRAGVSAIERVEPKPEATPKE